MKDNKKYDCSFDFDNQKVREKYKYIVVTRGDLDVNNAMMLKSEKDVKAYLEESNGYGKYTIDEIYAIGKVRWNK